MIGIMTSADCIEVELLHQFDLGAHVLFRERASTFGMVFMAVDAAQHEAFAVEQDNTVLDLYLTKADSATLEIHSRSLGVFERQNEAIQVRCFRRPFLRIFNWLRNDRMPHFDSALMKYPVVET